MQSQTIITAIYSGLTKYPCHYSPHTLLPSPWQTSLIKVGHSDNLASNAEPGKPH